MKYLHRWEQFEHTADQFVLDVSQQQALVEESDSLNSKHGGSQSTLQVRIAMYHIENHTISHQAQYVLGQMRRLFEEGDLFIDRLPIESTW